MNIVKEIEKIGLQMEFILKYITTGEKDMSILASIEADLEKVSGLFESAKSHVAHLKAKVAEGEATIVSHVETIAQAAESLASANNLAQKIASVSGLVHQKVAEFESWLKTEIEGGISANVSANVVVVTSAPEVQPPSDPVIKVDPVVTPVTPPSVPDPVIPDGPVTIKPL